MVQSKQNNKKKNSSMARHNIFRIRPSWHPKTLSLIPVKQAASSEPHCFWSPCHCTCTPSLLCHPHRIHGNKHHVGVAIRTFPRRECRTLQRSNSVIRRTIVESIRLSKTQTSLLSPSFDTSSDLLMRATMSLQWSRLFLKSSGGSPLRRFASKCTSPLLFWFSTSSSLGG